MPCNVLSNKLFWHQSYQPRIHRVGPHLTPYSHTGNKAQFATLDLDVNQQFATRYREREQEERAEKERLKQLVLEINERQEEEEQALIGQSEHRERIPYSVVKRVCKMWSVIPSIS